MVLCIASQHTWFPLLLAICLHPIKWFQVLLVNTNNSFDISRMSAHSLMVSSIVSQH